MSTAISTNQHHHLPLLATLSVVGVIATAGVVGVVWHESTTSSTQGQAPAVTQPKGADHNAVVAERGTESGSGLYGHYYRGQKVGLGEQAPVTNGGQPQLGLP